MKRLKSFIIIYMCICFCLSMASCGEDEYKTKTIYFSTYDTVSTFDPQLAKNSAELTIASNCFEGLMTKNKNGEIVKGMAKDYSVSDDEKTYAFTLRDDIMWSDGETKVTAADFCFGIKRAIDPNTASPYASSLYSIKNAEKINKGKMSVDKLGVSFDNNVLVIALNKADDGFLETLTKPLCAPCNEAFFDSTIGKYGLSNKTIISNGAFSINYHNTETKTVIIQNNEDYKGKNTANSKAIQISYGNDDKDIYSGFENSQTDVALIDSSYTNALSETGNTCKLFYSTNYCLYMSDKLISGTGVDLRKALSTAIDAGALNANIINNCKPVSGIIPSINTIGGSVYRDTVGDITIKKYNVKKAEKLLGDFDAASNLLNGESVYYPKGIDNTAVLCNLIVQGWQRDLNLYINSSAETAENIASKIKSGDILMAIIPVSSENNNAIASFNSLNKLKITKNAQGYSAKQLFKAEQKLIDSGEIYPIVSIPTAVSFTDKISGFASSADGKVIDFRFIKKD